MAGYKEGGALVQGSADLAEDGLEVFYPPQGLPGGRQAGKPGEALQAFLEQVEPGSYIALQAFLQPTEETRAALEDLRLRLRGRYGTATTLGFGPRFLHSTGQLHKGDAGRGLFIQLTADPKQDASIPDQPGEPGAGISFGVLLLAQALGDRQALLEAGRPVIRFHLGSDPAAGLQTLARALE
jgi:glucose-6-phosphate isomerase/transaldolase/glucose-6-phosphate isomerase